NNSILETRKEGGNFKDLSDFISRIDGSKVNKRVIEALTKSGAFDHFGYSRRAMCEQIELISDTVKDAMKAKKNAVGSLFGDDEELTKMDINLEPLEEYSDREVLEFEKASLGFYVSGHPLDEYREQLDQINYTLSSQIDEVADGSEVLFVGKVESITERISKKGNKFAIASIMDFHGSIELMMFEDKLKELKEDFDLEEPIAFKVRITKDDQFTRMNLRKIEDLRDAKKEKLKIKKVVKDEPPLTIAADYVQNDKVMYDLFEIIAHNQGKRKFNLIVKSKLGDIHLETGFSVTNNVEQLIKSIPGVYVV
ncbi:DNA polymerase III subunit alpha, partial [Arcobacter sp. HD9-500m-PIT-SAG03]